MRFIRDRRGQSVVVGTVILFGFLILALALYQVQVVPTENANIEFEHSQTVESDVTDLRNSITAAGTVGDGRATSVQLGTRYPQRTFFVNPPAVTGEIRTTEQRQLRIENANVTTTGNAGKFWANRTNNSTEPIEFETRSLRYRADYRELQDGPNLVYEHSVVAAEYRQTALLRTDQTLVREPSGESDHGRVTIPLLAGEFSENGLESRSVDTDSISASQRTVLVEPADGADTIEIVLPTAVQGDDRVNRTAAEWDDRLEGGTATPTAARDGIRLTLPADSYQLRLGLVGMGRNTPNVDESDGYITKVSTSGGVAVAEVRDRFNNPVEDANVTIDNGSDIQTETTNSDGRVSYTADGSPTDVRMWINDDGPDWEAVVFEDFGVAASGNATGINRVYDVAWNGTTIQQQDHQNITYIEAEGKLEIDDSLIGSPITVSGEVTDGSSPVHNATVDFGTTNSSVAGFDSDSSTTETVNGEFETALSVNAIGEGILYAASGDDVDSIEFEVVEPEEAPTVETRDATGVGQTEATLNGELTDLGTASEVDVSFQYRETGAATWIDTPTQTRTATGTFDETITGLSSNTEYEFRAVAESTDGSDTGEPLTFTTEEDQALSFDTVDVSDDSTSNPGGQNGQVSYTVEYTIDDPNNEFDRVEVEFENFDNPGVSETLTATGSPTDSVTHNPSQQNADFGDEYEITIRLYNTDGEVESERIVIADTADGTDP